MNVQTDKTDDVNGPGQPDLKRVMGPKLLLLFIVGDILGAGVYAVTGEMAGYVGGLLWVPFVLAFVVATLTALSYLELVTKYPQAAGAALYTHKAFGIHFVTFIVAFAVACSGITSASTSAKTLATSFFEGLAQNGVLDTVEDGKVISSVDVATVTLVAMGFMVFLALVNLKGVGESVKFNVILTVIESLALTIVILIGFSVIAKGDADLSALFDFEDYKDMGMVFAITAATSIAFFAMVGFEDSVNMVEETQNPEKIFPGVMLKGLGIACILYVLVAIAVVAVLGPEQLETISETGERALLVVVNEGAGDIPIEKIFPFLAVIAVSNTALINMLMASRLVYGMANQGVLPRALGRVFPGPRTPGIAIIFTTILALILIYFVSTQGETELVANLSKVTALLLLGVFAVVNVACLVLRRRDPDTQGFFRSPGITPAIGAVLCVYLVGPWVDRDAVVYKVALYMLLVGLVLWVVTWAVNKATGQSTEFTDVENLGE